MWKPGEMKRGNWKRGRKGRKKVTKKAPGRRGVPKTPGNLFTRLARPEKPILTRENWGPQKKHPSKNVAKTPWGGGLEAPEPPKPRGGGEKTSGGKKNPLF